MQTFGVNSVIFIVSILWNALTDGIEIVIMWQHSKKIMARKVETVAVGYVVNILWFCFSSNL